MERQSQSEVAGAGDGIKEAKDENGNCPENKDFKKQTKEKDLREKIKQYLKSNNDSTSKYEKTIKYDQVDSERMGNLLDYSQKPCNHFNDFGTCKYKSGHVSKSGKTNLIHICRFCHGSYGKNIPHPENLCAQLKSHGDLLAHGKPLQLDNLNTEVLRKGTDEELGEEISAKLKEPKVEMIVGVVGVIGRDAAVYIFKKTQMVESDGGMRIKNGARRRTAGGTFLQLLRENPHIDQESVASFFNKFNGVPITQMSNTVAERKIDITSSQVEPMIQPCNYFNDVGSCKFKAGHLSKSGLTSRLHICRVCFARTGEKNFHPEKECHLNPNTSLKTLVSMISSFNNAGAKPKFQDQGSKIRNKYSQADLTRSPEKFHPIKDQKGINAHQDKRGIQQGSQNRRDTSMNLRMDNTGNTSTPRSRLLQAKGIFEKGDKCPQIDKSTPKSRLTKSMGESNVGSKRNASTNDSMVSYVGRSRQNIGESKDRSNGSRKDQKLDSISQIIGCLNQPRTDFPKIKNHEENGLLADTRNDCKTKQLQYDESKGNKKTTGIRDEQWLADYNVAKQKAVHNLENGNLQSVGGISGYCGQTANVGHLNAHNQVRKLMAKLKMEGGEERRNNHEMEVRKTAKGNAKGFKESVIKTKHGMKKFSLNPSASPFSPSVAPFNPLTPPPFVGLPLKATHSTTFPENHSQGSHLKMAKGSRKERVNIDKNEKKKGDFSADHDKTPRPNMKRSSSLKIGGKKSDFSDEVEKGKSDPGKMKMKKRKNHCLCPPYCPDCLEGIKRNS